MPGIHLTFEKPAAGHGAASTLQPWHALLTDAAHAHRFSCLLDRIASFYSAVDGGASDFLVTLGVAPSDSPFRATIEGPAITLRLPGEPRHAGRVLGIVAHEVCHALFAAGTGRRCADLAAQARGGGLAHTVYAHLALDEALATAIGNGWLVRQLEGRWPGGAWYDDWHVATFARALAPLAAAALDRGATADAAFFARAMTRFQAAMGERLWELPVLLRHVAILADAQCAGGSAALVDRLAAQVDGLAEADAFDGIDSTNVARLLDCRATRIAVINAGDAPALRLLCAQLPWLGALGDGGGDAFVAGCVGFDAPAVCVFALARTSDFGAALGALLRRSAGRGSFMIGAAGFAIPDETTA